MSTGILPIVKQTALEAVENSQPCDLRYGEVMSVNPLKVKITPLFTLPASLLIVPHSLTTYEVNFNGMIYTVDNSLKIGDRVALLRQQGGQAYFILDRVSRYTPSITVE